MYPNLRILLESFHRFDFYQHTQRNSTARFSSPYTANPVFPPRSGSLPEAALFLTFPTHNQEAAMSKKTRKSRKALHETNNVIHPAFDDRDWHPLDTEIDRARDRKYVRNVKPRSEGQQKLMQAIKDYSLSFAIGPAGTGKTYLAITSAVEALEKGEVERFPSYM
jgi:hypothetical protein